MKDVSLSVLCKMYHITRRVIQGYEKEGLVKRIGKNKYGHLMYSNDSIKKVAYIRFLQINGLTLKEISKIMESSFNTNKFKKEVIKCNHKHIEESIRLNKLIEENTKLLKISNETQLINTIMEGIIK